MRYPLSLVCILIACIAGCSAKSESRTAADSAYAAASSFVDAIADGTLTYGEYLESKDALKAAYERLGNVSGVDTKLTSVQTNILLFQSEVETLGDLAFLKRELNAAGSGGLSPSETATIGVDQIKKFKSKLAEIETGVKSL